jgi:hypothetical protein
MVLDSWSKIQGVPRGGPTIAACDHYTIVLCFCDADSIALTGRAGGMGVPGVKDDMSRQLTAPAAKLSAL